MLYKYIRKGHKLISCIRQRRESNDTRPSQKYSAIMARAHFRCNPLAIIIYSYIVNTLICCNMYVTVFYVRLHLYFLYIKCITYIHLAMVFMYLCVCVCLRCTTITFSGVWRQKKEINCKNIDFLIKSKMQVRDRVFVGWAVG